MSKDERRDSAYSTFVNFSTPNRTQSLKSAFGRRNRNNNTTDEDVQSHRPVKANFVQLHVTSDDLPARPSYNDGGTRAVDATPVIPERTTSLRQKTNTWPITPRFAQRRDGSFRLDLIRTPWELARNSQPHSRWSRGSEKTDNRPKEAFPELPREIYQCIIDHVDHVHSQGANRNVTGIQSDLRALCLVNKTWHRFAREHLYGQLCLPSNERPHKRRFSREQKPSRLRQLLDILKSSPGLAIMVHRVHITSATAQDLDAEALSGSRKPPTINMVQQLVRLCYNLQHIEGYVPPATISTLPLMEALATRTHLASHVWKLDSQNALPSLADFVYCHDDWTRLETLVLSSDAGVDLGQATVSAILMRLPALKHLMLSGLHESDFQNSTLLTLPSLRSLRLENMRGLTDQGIEQLAYSRLAPSLESLTLVDLELVSLHTVQTLLSHLTRLRRFAFVQETSPEPQIGIRTRNVPIRLAASNLRDLHWDCAVFGTAISYFATAIQATRFPALRRIRAPCDYDGMLQRLCRPVPRVRLTQDDIEFFGERAAEGEYRSDLRVSWIRAQVRIREGGRKQGVSVVVQDEEGVVGKRCVFGSYLGDLGSVIEYDLGVGVGGGTRALVELEDVVGAVDTMGEGTWERKLDVRSLF